MDSPLSEAMSVAYSNPEIKAKLLSLLDFAERQLSYDTTPSEKSILSFKGHHWIHKQIHTDG